MLELLPVSGLLELLLVLGLLELLAVLGLLELIAVLGMLELFPVSGLLELLLVLGLLELLPVCLDVVPVLGRLHVTFVTFVTLVLPLSRVDGFVEVETGTRREHLTTELTREQLRQLPARPGPAGQEVLVSASGVPVTMVTQW